MTDEATLRAAADRVRTTAVVGLDLAGLLADWLDGAALDAAEIGADYRAVKFARALHANQASDVLISAETAAFLVAGHIDQLWYADQNDEGCCPVCCGPCWALKQLFDTGQLDNIVAGYAEREPAWWNTGTQQVDRVWLEGAWRMTACCGREVPAGV